MSSATNLLSELRADVASAKLLPALFVGLAMGVVLVIGAAAISALIFSGTAAPLAARGAGPVLFSALVLCLVIALTGGYRGVVSAPQDAPVAVAVSVVAVAGASMAGAGDETLFITLVVLLILTTAAGGFCVLLIGHVRIGDVLRFVPYPVVGGYLAGSGWILMLAALAIMSGIAPTWETLPVFWNRPRSGSGCRASPLPWRCVSPWRVGTISWSCRCPSFSPPWPTISA